jgi:hypothetical protein
MMAGRKVLLMMGCPEVPIQTSIVLYLMNKLNKAGFDTTAAGNDAAIKLLKVADPEGHYVKNTMDIDHCIEDIIERRTDFDICFAFMHNDAGMTYAATVSAISTARFYSVVFGKNAESLAETIEFPCEKIVAKAVHNPIPLKTKLDRVAL